MAHAPESAPAAPPPPPRWVKLFGLVAVLLVLVLVIGLLTGHAGPGQHGPGRHMGMLRTPVERGI